MLIHLQPMGSFIAPLPIGICVVILLLSIALFTWLKKKGKLVQAIFAPVVLLAVFLGVLLYEMSNVYSLEYRDGRLFMNTPLGTKETACQNIEFLVRRYKNSCVVLGFRDSDELFHSVSVNRAQCKALEEELRHIPCKPSDKSNHSHIDSLR